MQDDLDRINPKGVPFVGKCTRLRRSIGDVELMQFPWGKSRMKSKVGMPDGKLDSDMRLWTYTLGRAGK